MKWLAVFRVVTTWKNLRTLGSSRTHRFAWAADFRPSEMGMTHGIASAALRARSDPATHGGRMLDVDGGSAAFMKYSNAAKAAVSLLLAFSVSACAYSGGGGSRRNLA